MSNVRPQATRPRRPRSRRSTRGSMGRTVLLGLALMPVVCGLTFVSLVVVSEAALGPGLPSVDLHGLEQMAVNLGLLPQPQPTEAAFVPLPTIDAEPAGLPAAVVPETPPAPSDTATSTSTATETATATSTSTATSTATSTPTFTETTTATPTPTVSPTHTLAATQTPPRKFTPTRTPTRTHTPTPTVTQTPTAAPPTETPSPTVESRRDRARCGRDRDRNGLAHGDDRATDGNEPSGMQPCGEREFREHAAGPDQRGTSAAGASALQPAEPAPGGGPGAQHRHGLQQLPFAHRFRRIQRARSNREAGLQLVMGGGEHLRHGQHVLKRTAAGVRLVDEQRPASGQSSQPQLHRHRPRLPCTAPTAATAATSRPCLPDRKREPLAPRLPSPFLGPPASLSPTSGSRTIPSLPHSRVMKRPFARGREPYMYNSSQGQCLFITGLGLAASRSWSRRS